MLRKVSLAIGEVYHVYNRGAHKAQIFTSNDDYERFMLLLYLGNSASPVFMRDITSKYRNCRDRFSAIFAKEELKDPIVDVLAYSLMPNHFHIILRQRVEKGITTFMRRIMVGYAMYFNTKYGHGGVLFQGRFKSVHADSDAYFRYLFAYVHLNPLDLIAPEWKEKGVSDANAARRFMNAFRYSSYWDYCVGDRPERAILSKEPLPDFVTHQNDLEDLLQSFAENRSLQVDGDKS